MQIENSAYTSISELSKLLNRTKRATREFVKKANVKCDGKLIYQHKNEAKIWVRIPVLMEFFPELILNTRAGISFRVHQLAQDVQNIADELKVIEQILAITDIDKQDEDDDYE